MTTTEELRSLAMFEKVSESELRDLIALLDAHRHLTFEDRPASEVDAALDTPPQVGARLAGLRTQSDAYLDRVLA